MRWKLRHYQKLRREDVGMNISGMNGKFFEVFNVSAEHFGDAPLRGEGKVTCRSRRAAMSDERGVTMKIAFVQP